MTEVPPGRYRVIYSTDNGGYTEFSAADDEAAWEHAERAAYGAHIVQLGRIQITAGGDRHQLLARPVH